MGAPSKLRQPVHVSARIERPLADMIKECKLEIRPLIERGFEASIPKGMSAYDYALSLKEKDIIQKRRLAEDLKLRYEEAVNELNISIQQKDLMMDRSLDSHLVNEDQLLDNILPMAERVLEKFEIKQKAWKGDHETVAWILDELEVELSYDQLFRWYEQMRDHIGKIRG